MPPLLLGSMCTGYAGLDMAISQVLAVKTAWVADPAPGPTAVLAHHMPDVPNLGSITAVDWGATEPVDVVAAGFPCQDISYAGRGAGIREGTRSGLWHAIADALGVLRPRLVVLENVAAIVGRRPGLDVVLADLAALGFDAEWACVRASDVGAPHPRNRWFLVAHPGGLGRWPGTGLRQSEPPPVGGRRSRHNDGTAAPDTAGDGRHERWPEPTGVVGGPDAALGRDVAAHPQGVGHGHAGPAGVRRLASTAVAGDPSWGDYGPAIDRWTCVLGRPAPAPVEPGRSGARLSPSFVEWLMGLPEGWVTDVPRLTRNQQLGILGNGVVPHQGAAALAHLIDRCAAGTLNRARG
jgi:DNA (cytosine-5)-methyltransferase 1